MVSTAINLHEVNARLTTTRKRSRSNSENSDHEGVQLKRSCYGFWKLNENQYSGIWSDGEASVLSLQKYETDVPQDTPFDDTSSEYDSSDVVEIEYECVSDSDQETFLSDISTGNEATLAVGAIAAVLCDSSLEPWLSDREDGDSDNSSVEGAELERTKWRLCIQCKGENNNPLYRYCQECFQKRKELFPPRPKGFKKRDELEEKTKKKHKLKVCSQDSGIGSFESDIPLKRKRTSISDYESNGDTPKRFKLGANVIGNNNNLFNSKEIENCHEVPILKVHTAKDSTEFCKKSDDLDKVTGTVACVSNELDVTKKGKSSSWIKKTVIIEEDENEDQQSSETTYKENYEFKPNGFAVTKELCMMCASVTKDSIFLHGITGHLACCYQCSIKTWKTTKCCPVCKAKVRNVVKIYS